MKIYNGAEPQPDRKILRLSDLYTVKTKEAQLELTAVLLNINRNHNRELKLIPGYRHDILHGRCGREVWQLTC